MPIDHLRRARAAWPLLAVCAANGMPPYTYREISDEVGVHWRSAPHFLGVIRRYCRMHGLPPLQVLVVNAATRLPGQGCPGTPRTRPVYQAVLREIYAYPWPTKVPF